MLGPQLKNRMLELGLKTNFVSKQVYISYEALKKYFRGETKIPKSKALLLCLYFGFDPSEFGLNTPYYESFKNRSQMMDFKRHG